MRAPRWLRALGWLCVLTAGCGYAYLSLDHCGAWTPAGATLQLSKVGSGQFRAGAARVEIRVPFPAVVAGYGPPRPSVASSTTPLHARALVLEVGGVSVALVTADVLLSPDAVADAVRARTNVDDVFLAATHTHSSFGGYDARWVAQLAGTGAYDPRMFEALVAAISSAVQDAAGRLEPTAAWREEGTSATLNLARSGSTVDRTWTHWRFVASGTAVSDLWLVAGHPTLAGRRPAALDGDYPALAAQTAESKGHGVTLVVQSAAGNASTRPEQLPAFLNAWAERPAPSLDAAGPADLSSGVEVELRVERRQFTLPRPDATRAVPWVIRAVADNALCHSFSKSAQVSRIALGPLQLVGVPFEVTRSAADTLDPGPGVGLVSMVNGYLGYVDDDEAVASGSGESKRQLFSSPLRGLLHDAISSEAREPSRR